MEIRKTMEGDRLSLVVIGRLETATAPLLDAELKAMDEGVKNLSVDFKDLEYITSAGLRVILTAQKTMNARQGRMEIAGANETIRHVFAMTGFASVLTFT